MAMKSKNLMKSTSGVRGIIGRGLTATLVSEYGAALGTIVRRRRSAAAPVVIGRDTRPSGAHFLNALSAGLVSTGVDVVNLGVAPTPTVEMAVIGLKAAAGVCVTASHNPAPWNALKFFNERGEFIDERALAKLEERLLHKSFNFETHDKLGCVSHDEQWIDRHISRTLKLPAVNRPRLKKAGLTVVVDAVNGAGSVALPELLRQLGVRVITLNCRPDGLFPHPPEPTPDNLAQLSRAVRRNRADLGLATDPDADRLALVDERGRPIGEELTLALAVRQVLSVRQSPVVINLSTSRVTADVARELGQKVYYSRVGEANVVALMKKRSSIIGGEGNGGVIYGALHYGRDSLAAAALALSSLAQSGGTLSELAGTLPTYYTIKGKAPLPQSFSSRLKEFERRMLDQWGGLKVDRRDGVRLDFPEGWVLIRASNTEPIYRIVVETTGAAMTRKIMKQTRGFFR